MPSPRESTEEPIEGARTRSALVTATIWVVGVALQFATPLLRGRVELSDDLFIGSFLYPWWMFLQLAALTGTLALLRRWSSGWRPRTRVVVGVGVALLWMLPYPDLLSTLFAEQYAPLAQDPVRAALLWSVPLTFYLAPSAVIVTAWLKRDVRLSLTRALGLGLVLIGVLSFPFLLWLGHLWDAYIRPSGGESISLVSALRSPGS